MENTIIHPTDFSVCANKALDYAIIIAKSLNLKISIVHAVNFDEIDKLERNALNILEETKVLRFSAEKKLKKLVKKVEANEIKCDYNLCSGRISAWLPDFTNKNNPKLIVMGTTGSASLRNKIIGSNTYSIIKETNVPLLSVPEKAVLRDFRRLIFLSDYKDKDILSIGFLVEMAARFNSVIDIAHILDSESVKKSNNQKLLNELKLKVEENFKHDQFEFQLLFSDNVEQRVKSLIEETNPELIALVMRKQNFFERLFFGSLTEKIAYNSKSPLLVFPLEGNRHS
jgi:nucleotide-binding universal stress UspA family protein